LAHALDQRIAIFTRHADVGDQNVRPRSAQQIECFICRAGAFHSRTTCGQDAVHEQPRVRLIIDGQNATPVQIAKRLRTLALFPRHCLRRGSSIFATATGSVSVNVEP
jgi:hypothetical protein